MGAASQDAGRSPAAGSGSDIASVTDTFDMTAARMPPGVVVCAVGDVHGRLDLLEPPHLGALIAKCASSASASGTAAQTHTESKE